MRVLVSCLIIESSDASQIGRAKFSECIVARAERPSWVGYYMQVSLHRVGVTRGQEVLASSSPGGGTWRPSSISPPAYLPASQSAWSGLPSLTFAAHSLGQPTPPYLAPTGGGGAATAAAAGRSSLAKPNSAHIFKGQFDHLFEGLSCILTAD